MIMMMIVVSSHSESAHNENGRECYRSSLVVCQADEIRSARHEGTRKRNALACCVAAELAGQAT